MRQTRSNQYNRKARSPFITAEGLEIRRLLSALPDPSAAPVDSVISADDTVPAGQASPPGFSPAQIKEAYGINNISFNGTAGTGAGQTIAIVAAYDNPEFVDSSSPDFDNSDLHKFDVAMGLPDPPSFTKVDENGGTNYPTVDPGWANEIALDVEWSHALAPEANILLVEASSTDLYTLIEGAGNTARDTAGVSVVTMSFAVTDFFGENQYDEYLTTPTSHNGITFVAASGDDGDPGGYPAFSPNVVSVGATTLTLTGGNSYGSEVGHNTSGGGISQFEPKPTYQSAVTQSSTNRTTPDVSFDGDPNTGVSVYDSYNGGSATPWYKVGGTSFSAPAWGALMAIADQGRARAGLGTLDGPSQTLPRLYELNSADFHDITSGTTDGPTPVSAGPGYDLVTGLGTPVANLLVPALAGGNTVTGTIENAGTGTGISGFTVFSDFYQSGTVQGTDISETSGSNGTFEFTDMPGGTFTFDTVTAAGWTLTSPSSTFTVTLGYGSTSSGNNVEFQSNGQASQLVFTQQPTAIDATDNITPAITIAVENSSGNIITTDNSTVTLLLGSGNGPLSGTLSQNAVNGIATFGDISVDAAGTDVITAIDGALAAANSSSFVVSAAPQDVATQLVFGQQPTDGVAGVALNPPLSVYLEDPKGHVVATDSSAVTLSLAAGSTANSPTGTLTVNAVDGIARFSNIIFTSAGTAALTATDGTLTSATSNTFTTKIEPTQLGFAQAPAPVNIGVPFDPPIVVDVEDFLGNPVAGSTSAVTLAITGGAATLGGTATVDAVNGVATFTNVSIPTAGTYQLTATSGSLTYVISNSFAASAPGTVAPSVGRSTVPASLIAGSKMHASVNVTETDTAAGNAVSNITTQIYAVGTDGASTLIGSVTRKTPLRSGKAFAVSVPITLVPDSLNGTYAIEAEVTDPSGNVTIGKPLETISVAAPKLAFSESFIKLTLPPAVIAGATNHAAATVKIINSGNIESVGETTVGIYASPDGLMDDATLIAAVARPIPIKPKGSALVTVPLTKLPASLSGSYTILAQVTDPTQAVTSVSSNEVVKIAPPFVSLSATVSAPAPSTVAAGKSVEVTFTVDNAGNTNASGAATIDVGLSSDQSTELPGGTTLTKPMRIAAGKSAILRLKIAVPSTLAAGKYYPFVSLSLDGNSVSGIGSALTVT